jgi:predicted PurR-regulated permease PerM
VGGRRRLANRSLAALGATAIALSAWIVRDFLLAMAVAAFLAALLHPVHASGRRRFGRHARLYALLFTLGVLILIVAPLGLLVWLIVKEVLQAVSLLRGALGPGGVTELLHGTLPPPVAKIVARIGAVLPVSADSLRADLASLSRYVAPTLGGLLAFSGATALDLFIMLLALFYFFLDGERLAAWLVAILPWPPRYSRELFDDFRKVSFGMVVGTGFAMVLSGALAWLGYLALHVPDPLVWGTLTGALTIAPVVGSAIVWVPVAAVLALTGHLVRALLLVGYALVVLVLGVDHLLRPLLVGRQMTLHPLLVFLGIFGGVATLGFSGLVIGPLVLAMAAALLQIYRRDFAARS